MSHLLNIPKHERCSNCGECCGVIPVTESEIRQIKEYIERHGIEPRASGLSCPFRNEVEKKCDIYPVRPAICRLMGVTKGMRCPNGNTVEIDGGKFLTPGSRHIILNLIFGEMENGNEKE